MVTTVSGKHIDLGSALINYVKNRIDSGVKKYLLNITQSRVVFSKNSFLFHAEIIIHDSIVGLVKSDSESDDVYSAFDSAIIKIEKQLRKYKGKINIHSQGIKAVVAQKPNTAIKYILDNRSQTDSAEENFQDHEPITIAEKQTDIEHLTVSEAIMKMDLAHLPALLFINKLSQRINLVYHRHDGNISWVDPEKI